MNRTATLLVAASVLVVASSVPASATHSWNGYHWARTTASFNLKVTDSVTSGWQLSFDQSLVEWNKSSKLENVVVASDAGSTVRKQCRAVLGQMRVCNASYGSKGWLGLASINLDSSGQFKNRYGKRRKDFPL